MRYKLTLGNMYIYTENSKFKGPVTFEELPEHWQSRMSAENLVEMAKANIKNALTSVAKIMSDISDTLELTVECSAEPSDLDFFDDICELPYHRSEPSETVLYHALEQAVDTGYDGMQWAYGVADIGVRLGEESCTLVFKVLKCEKIELSVLGYTEDLESVISAIFAVIYSTVYIDHVVCKGKKYYQRATRWDETHPDDNSSETCNGYSDCELSDVEDSEGKIDYVLVYSENHFDEKLPKQISEKLLKGEEMKTEVFPKNLKVLLRNESGINKDHRGSDHVKINLDFHDEYEVCGTTFGDLADAAMRIKSHKFDFWYELYSYVTFIYHDYTLMINVSFDHGS